jgi:hypothetical protein
MDPEQDPDSDLDPHPDLDLQLEKMLDPDLFKSLRIHNPTFNQNHEYYLQTYPDLVAFLVLSLRGGVLFSAATASSPISVLSRPNDLLPLKNISSP